MVLSFKDLQDRVMQVLDETSTNSPTTLTLVKSFLNQSHQHRCTEFPWNFMLWPKAVTFSTVSGQQVYALHEEYHRPLYFLNQTTRQYLEEIPNRMVVENAGDWNDATSVQSVTKFMPWGMQPVAVQPTTTSAVSVISSSTSDTGSKTVTITGELSSGFITTETLSMNGTTLVTGTTQFQEIIDVVKSTAFSGTITLALVTEGTSILSLGPTQYGKQFKTMFFPETISGAETIEYRFYRQPRILVNDYDLPNLPSPHEGILVYDTLISMSGYLTDTGPQTLRIWQDKQASAQMALYQAYANEAQSLGGGTSFVRWVGDADPGPRSYR